VKVGVGVQVGGKVITATGLSGVGLVVGREEGGGNGLIGTYGSMKMMR